MPQSNCVFRITQFALRWVDFNVLKHVFNNDSNFKWKFQELIVAALEVDGYPKAHITGYFLLICTQTWRVIQAELFVERAQLKQTFRTNPSPDTTKWLTPVLPFLTEFGCRKEPASILDINPLEAAQQITCTVLLRCLSSFIEWVAGLSTLDIHFTQWILEEGMAVRRQRTTSSKSCEISQQIQTGTHCCSEILKHSNQMKSWISDTLLQETELKQRVRLLSQFLQIALVTSFSLSSSLISVQALKDTE